MKIVLDVGALFLWILFVIISVGAIFWTIYVLSPDERKRRPIHYLYVASGLMSLTLLSLLVLSSTYLSVNFDRRVGYSLSWDLLAAAFSSIGIGTVVSFMIGASKLRKELNRGEEKET